MWGHIKKQRGKQKPRKLRLLSSTKGEENRIELCINCSKSKIAKIETAEIEEYLYSLYTLLYIISKTNLKHEVSCFQFSYCEPNSVAICLSDHIAALFRALFVVF